jgi:RNA polymerase sigma-70 factor (ECF subfamily)
VTPSAFAEIFDAHWPRVCAYIARRGRREAVEDVAAEVFAIAWRRRRDLPADPLPWLLRTARNLLSNERRANASREALSQLNEKDREVIMLIHWDGLTAAQAARIIGCSHAAARARLMRARRRLAEGPQEPVRCAT